jgi:hypothetical protein
VGLRRIGRGAELQLAGHQLADRFEDVAVRLDRRIRALDDKLMYAF